MSRRSSDHYGGYRERSPSRDSRSGRPDSRQPRRDQRFENQDRGRHDYPRQQHSSRREHDSSSHSSSSSEKLADIPIHVSVPKSGRALQPLERRPQGRVGRPLRVKINCFGIQSLSAGPVFSYSLSFSIPPEFQRRGIAAASLQQQARAMVKGSSLFGRYFVYDGVSEGWSTHELLPRGTTRSAAVDMENGTKIEIQMRANGPLRLETLASYLGIGKAGTVTNDKDLELCFKYLNALFRQFPASQWITRPKSTAFFHRSPKLCMPLATTGNVLEAIRGIYQSVAVGFGHLSINVDTCCAAFYTPDLNLIEVTLAFAGLKSHDLKSPNGIGQFIESMPRLVGMFFCVRHLDTVKNGKKIRVMAVGNKDAISETFELKDSSTGQVKTISISDYFLERYDIRLRFPQLPLLRTRAGMFPVEVCYSAPGERYNSTQATPDFIKWATSPAFVRSAQVLENVQRLQWHAQGILNAHGVSVATKMLDVPASVLPAPVPEYARGTDREPPTNGAWNLRGKRFMQPSRFKSYGLCYFPSGRKIANDQELQRFCRDLVDACADYGLGVPNGPPAYISGNPNGNVESVIGGLMQKTSTHFQSKPDVFFFLLHDSSPPSLYKAVKAVCEVKLGVVSQCMIVEKAVWGKGRAQYLANIASKVNVKLVGPGGVNCSVRDPFLSKKKVMQVGADVSHPSPAELRRQPPPPSFAALTANYDQANCLYTAVAHAQEATKEPIFALKAMFKELLKRYTEKMHGFPEVVILWRDGLSESQISAFIETEIAAFKQVRAEVSASFTITAVIGVKRHHVRLFPSSERGDKNGNVLPGTLVEASVKDGDCDVFLVTASALQGTVRPCRYWRVYDESSGFTVDDISRLVMNSCFSYARATRSVGQHSAIYYSHQVAERARIHLQRNNQGGAVLPQVHDDLKYTMYWQ